MTAKPPKLYASPGAFETAFNSKYRGRPERALVILMQRFAARVCHVIDGAVVKGGLGLDLRLDTPRTTLDADIIISASHNLDNRLSEAGKLEMGDYLRFKVAPDAKWGEINAPSIAYSGKRYKVQALFTSGPGPWSAKPARSFSAEISVRHPAGFDTLESAIEEFPQIPAAPIRVYSLAWQIAEKVHAYTDPHHRESLNPDAMRPRDLVDICRCATATTPDARLNSSNLRSALVQTFDQRKSAALAKGVSLQDLPRHLPSMPASWEPAFLREVERSALRWKTSAEAHRVAAHLLGPVLDGSAEGDWDPAQQRWIAAAGSSNE